MRMCVPIEIPSASSFDHSRPSIIIRPSDNQPELRPTEVRALHSTRSHSRLPLLPPPLDGTNSASRPPYRHTVPHPHRLVAHSAPTWASWDPLLTRYPLCMHVCTHLTIYLCIQLRAHSISRETPRRHHLCLWNPLTGPQPLIDSVSFIPLDHIAAPSLTRLFPSPGESDCRWPVKRPTTRPARRTADHSRCHLQPIPKIFIFRLPLQLQLRSTIPLRCLWLGLPDTHRYTRRHDSNDRRRLATSNPSTLVTTARGTRPMN